MAQKTKAELTELAEANNVDISDAKTNADIEQRLTDAGVDLNGNSSNDSPDTTADPNSNVDDSVSASLADEARELGIEPASYTSAKQLQERVDHVRAEKEATAGDTSMTEARQAARQERERSRTANAGNANLSNASDAEAENLKSKNQ